MPDDPFDLARFVAAQDDCYAQALAELRAGRNASHWMWFVFPQFAAALDNHFGGGRDAKTLELVRDHAT